MHKVDSAEKDNVWIQVVLPSRKDLWQEVLELKVEFPLETSGPLEKGALDTM